MRRLQLTILAGLVLAGCSTFKQVKESQMTSAEAEIAAVPDSVMTVVLEVLPQFHLIATATYRSGGFIQARGDWDSDQEGALVQVTVREENGGAKVVVEAGGSEFKDQERKLKLARAVMAKIRERFSASP